MLLNSNYIIAKENIEDGLDLLLNQKLYEIEKLNERLVKMENENNGQTMALNLQLEDTDNLKEKLKHEVKKLESQVNKTDTYIGYS